MAANIRQYFADCNGNTLQATVQQNPAMEIAYRRILAANVDALLKYRGKGADNLAAVYLDGSKKGKKVSARTIRYILRGDEVGGGIDALAAIAQSLGVQLYHLFVPSLDPMSHPPGATERWIEDEVERRVVARLRNVDKNTEPEEPDEQGAPKRTGRKNPFIDSEASVGSTPSSIAEAKAETASGKRRRVKQSVG